MLGNYFFIDGSSLTAQIRQLRRENPSFRSRKLCPKRLIDYYANSLSDLSSNQFKRATFYFPIGDEAAVEDYLAMPDHKLPGEIRNLHFKFCGQKLKRTAELKEFVETKVPPKWRDHFNKSEKGIDIEICCDALKLASASRLERLFLFTNDDDFIPLCRTIKEFGANISIVHLSDTVTRNISLLREVDSYDVVAKLALESLFDPVLEGLNSDTQYVQAEEPVSALKPEVPPPNLAVDRDDAAEAVTSAKAQPVDKARTGVELTENQ